MEINLFEAPATSSHSEETPTGSYLETLVGEGKKFKDAEALAKGKAEADAYIRTMERKLDDLNKELGTRMSLEDFMKTQVKPTSTNTNTNGTSNAPATAGHERSTDGGEESNQTLTREEVASLVRDALSQEQTKAARSKNLQEAQKMLMDTWGPRTYTEKLTEAADRLGLGKEFLSDIAARSPVAFMELVGAKATSTNNTPSGINNPPQSTHRIADDGYNPNIRNEVWWARFRKENPKEYFNESNTVKRHKDATSMGAAFFTKK